MPRFREPYTLFQRDNGVYYYRTYTPTGKRTVAKSTGLKNKTAARQYCDKLLSTGKLYDGSSKRFKDFALGFYDEGRIWHSEKTLQTGVKKISDSYIRNQRYLLKFYIMPYFSENKLEDFKPGLIKQFRVDLTKKNLSLRTVNLVTACLKTILMSAYEDNLIFNDPFKGIKPLYEEKNKREAFTIDEVTALLLQDWEHENVKIFILTAALTGMRRSEILAIRKENLHENFIDVKDQFLHGKYDVLKNKYARKIPIIKNLSEILHNETKKNNETAFYFNPDFYNRQLQKNICFIPDRKERNLSLHSLRHFFNTYLLAENVSSAKVAAVIGHSSGQGSMQELYTSWKPELMPEVYAAQEKLFHTVQN